MKTLRLSFLLITAVLLLNPPETSSTNNYCDSNKFDGSDRRAAKLSLATATVEDFDNLTDMIATLPLDASMGTTHVPVITTGPKSKRVAEEKRNVHVKSAWIYAYKRETDEDYHVIVGSTNDKATAKFFNIEVSGLPAASVQSFAELQAVRNTFETLITGHNNCSGTYEEQFMTNSKEIEFAGSLFFDKLHFSNHASIGHKFAKAKSYWEVHPVSGLVVK